MEVTEALNTGVVRASFSGLMDSEAVDSKQRQRCRHDCQHQRQIEQLGGIAGSCLQRILCHGRMVRHMPKNANCTVRGSTSPHRCGTLLPKMVVGRARGLITTIEPTPQTVYNNHFTNLHTQLGEFSLDATDNKAANQD